MTSDGGLPTEEDVRQERAAARRAIKDHERRDPGCAWLALAMLWLVLSATVIRWVRRA